MKTSSFINDAKYLGIILFLSILVYLGHEPTIVWDMTWYVVRGLNILNGYGYIGADQLLNSDSMLRGPIFPAMLSAALWVESSPESVFWVVRGFAILIPIMVYFLCRQTVSVQRPHIVAFTAAILYMSYWAPNYASLRHLDAIWPFFILLGMYIYNLAVEANKKSFKISYAIATSIILVIAYLIKEAAIVFFTIPAAYWLLIPKFRTKENFFLGVFTGFIVFLFLTPWLIYVYNQTGAIPLLGKIGGLVLYLYSSQEIQPFLASGTPFFEGLKLVFWGSKNSLFNVFPIGFLFPISWGYVAYKSLGQPKYRLFIFMILIVHFNAVQGWRIGHNIILYIFSFMTLSVFLLDVLEMMYKKIRITNKLNFKHIILAFILVGFFVPNASGKTNYNFLSGSFAFQLFGIKDSDKRGVNYFDRNNYDPILKVLEKDNAGRVLIDHPAYANAIYFYLNAEKPIFFMDAVYCYAGGVAGEGYKGSHEDVQNLSPLYYDLKAHRWPPYPALILFEKHLLDQIKENKITHVILTGAMKELSEYFYQTPLFEKIEYTTAEDWSVWRVRPDAPLKDNNNRTYVDEKVLKNILNMMGQNKGSYEKVINAHKECLGQSFDKSWFEEAVFKRE